MSQIMFAVSMIALGVPLGWLTLLVPWIVCAVRNMGKDCEPVDMEAEIRNARTLIAIVEDQERREDNQCS